MVSDIVTLKALPENVKRSLAAYVGCLSGAVAKEEYISIIRKAGFKDIKIVEESVFPLDCMLNDPTAKALLESMKIDGKEIQDVTNSISSIKVSAIKP